MKRSMQKQFNERAVELIRKCAAGNIEKETSISCGAYQTPTFEFACDSKYGPLSITVFGVDKGQCYKGEGIGDVFFQFKDSELARKSFDCNPHSGKWNAHYFTEDIETAISDLEYRLSRVFK